MRAARRSPPRPPSWRAPHSPNPSPDPNPRSANPNLNSNPNPNQASPALLAALGHAWLAQLAGPLLSALANALLASFLVGGPLLFLVQQAVYASYAAGLVTHNQAPRLLNAMGLRDWGATAAQEESEVLLK